MLPPEVPIPPEEAHSHHHLAPTGNRWLDKMLPVSAILISLISLIVGIHHGNIMNEMARDNARAAEASVWPFLQLDAGNTRGNDAGNVYVDLVNKGVGPARVESFEFFYQGRAFADAQQLLKNCCFSGVPSGGTVRTQTADVAPGVIAAKETALVFQLPREGMATTVWDKYDSLRQRGAFSARACYCSVFDKCWKTDFKSAQREPVAACPAVKVQFQGVSAAK
jgi:hypothetical protein